MSETSISGNEPSVVDSIDAIISPPPRLDETVKRIHWFESLDAVVRGHNSTKELMEQAFSNYQRKEFKDARARLIIVRHECTKMEMALDALERLQVEDK